MSEPRGPGGPFKCDRCGLVHFGACRDQSTDESLIEFVTPDDEFSHGLGEVDGQDVT